MWIWKCKKGFEGSRIQGFEWPPPSPSPLGGEGGVRGQGPRKDSSVEIKGFKGPRIQGFEYKIKAFKRSRMRV
jgi:hypothetical protein